MQQSQTGTFSSLPYGGSLLLTSKTLHLERSIFLQHIMALQSKRNPTLRQSH
jgi:hypothetical protein